MQAIAKCYAIQIYCCVFIYFRINMETLELRTWVTNDKPNVPVVSKIQITASSSAFERLSGSDRLSFCAFYRDQFRGEVLGYNATMLPDGKLRITRQTTKEAPIDLPSRSEVIGILENNKWKQKKWGDTTIADALHPVVDEFELTN